MVDSMTLFSPTLRRAVCHALFLAGMVNSSTGAEPKGNAGLTLVKWSGQLNVPDPVACSVDPQGRVYVTSTTRRKAADLDIREHLMWVPDDLAFTSVDDKSAFLKRELAPGKLRVPRGMLKDHNGDGSIDWHDLTALKERIYQLRDTDGDGVADKMTVFAEGFNSEVNGIAAGVLWHEGWVYVTVAPELWRLKDTDDDGVADVRELLVRGMSLHFGYAGHDMHGLMVGPDGRIYWSNGDKGVNVTSKEGRHFFYPNEGSVFRIEPDGSGFEIYAHGLRNVQEPAFDDFGDLFGVDNDADMKGERERFVQILEGSDSGWRCNYQYMMEASPWMKENLWKPAFDGQSAHHLPPLSNYSDGPAGFRHDPGTALSNAQRGMFLLNEFPSGKMRGFRVVSEGDTYRMVDAQVLHDGVMGIGMTWHPDGSLMMVDWIGGYPLDGLGAVWKVDAASGIDAAERRETQKLIAAGFDARSVTELRELLGHRDQRVRQGAQFALVAKNEGGALLAAARDVHGEILNRIHGIWGWGQLLRRKGVAAADILPLLGDPDPEIRRQVIRILGDAPQSPGSMQSVIPCLADESPRVRVQAAIALGKQHIPDAVDALWRYAEAAGTDPVSRHAAVFALAGCATPDKLAARKTSDSAAQRMAAVLALRRIGSPRIGEYLSDADHRVVAEAVRGIHDDRGIPGALPALATLLDRKPDDEAVARRTINANLRLGTEDAADRLLTYSLDDSVPSDFRAEALNALRIWLNPPSLDLVDGCARTFHTGPIADLLSKRLGDLLAIRQPALKSLAIRIMIAHSLKASPDQIASIVMDDGAAADQRALALKLLGKKLLEPGLGAKIMSIALEKQSPVALHMAAMEALLADQPQRLVDEARIVLATRSDVEKQHAIALLARSRSREADTLLEDLGSELVTGKCEPALKLDVIEALKARAEAGEKFGKLVEAYAASESARTHSELLRGGDREAGESIVSTHLNANCLACHSLSNNGGSEVGPNLRTIGSQRRPEELLESLLAPSAKIATGFGLVTVVLRDGSTVNGTLAKEDAAMVSVRQFDGKYQHIARSDIKDRSQALSIMPPMQGILQPREIRDVVAYLSSLKSGRRNRATEDEDGRAEN